MIEGGHLEALRLVAQRAERLAAEGKIQEVDIPTKQMIAIRELDATRVEIFTKYGVPDVEPTTSSAYYEDHLSLERLSVKDLIRHYRNMSGFTMRELAERMGYSSEGTVAGLGGQPTMRLRTVRSFIIGLGWQETDPQAIYLLWRVQQQNLASRQARGQSNLSRS